MMPVKIIKRNGSEVAFDSSKIANAVRGANDEAMEADRLTDEEIREVAEKVEGQCASAGHTVTVEEVQDLVEDQLMAMGFFDVARRYIRYRYIQSLKRQKNTTDDRIMSLIEYDNEEAKQENSNKNPMVVSVQRDYIAGEVSKDITMRTLLPEDVVKAHEEGIIHFHDADYFIQPSFNCFSGGTRFITEDGPKKFCSFKDGETVFVKDMHGVIREATVHVYGRQKMQRVTLKNTEMERTIVCTPNHRWYLRDGSVTTDLKVGDKLYLTEDSTGYSIDSYDDAKAFCTGFVVGNGSDSTRNGVRLCGDKIKYRGIFEMAGYRCTSLNGTDDVVMRKPGAIKRDFINGKGWRHMTAEHRALCFKGYYAADGARDGNSVSTEDDRICLFIEETSGIAGYYISSVADVTRDTKDSRLVTYHFITKTPTNWTVTDISPYGHDEVPAYCVEEPVTNSFTLESGIVTGNCCLVNLEDMLQNGTVISGTMIERPHSFSTACNIATQIIAQVASCQYGGQSISLTHLAPFVDVSRREIRNKVIADIIACGGNADKDVVDRITESRVLDEVNKGIQTIQYQVITLMTTNGQAPFLTVYMYLNEARNEREKHDLAMIIEEFLRQRYQGVKNEVGAWITPAFPKLIYVLDEDNIHEGDPYFYLTELAAKCTARRMVPDYISAKMMRQLKLSKGEKPGEGDVYTCMGCRSFLTPDRSGNGWDNKSRALNHEPNKPKYYGRLTA